MRRFVLGCLAIVTACGRVGFDATRAGGRDGDGSPEGSVAGAPSVFLLSSDSSSSTLFSVDLATGQLTQLGVLAGVSALHSLAYWDANTLYAMGAGALVQITLSPFGATPVAATTDPGATIVAMQRSGDTLLAFDSSTSELTGVPGGALAGAPVQFQDQGGGESLQANEAGLARLSDGTWRLYAFDGHFGALWFQLDTTGIIDAGPGHPSVAFSLVGMVRDDADHLFAIGAADSNLYELDRDGNLVGQTTLCVTCPAPYVVPGGDLTRAP